MGTKEPGYFKSPAEAVPIIANLLRKRDWVSLSKYYCLDDSQIDFKQLEGGEFFVNTSQAEVSIFSTYKHPFDPAFEYDHHTEKPDGIVIVVLSIEIDQGDGSVKRGFDFFKLKRTPEGFQVLPDPVDSERFFGGVPDSLSPPDDRV